MHVYTNKRTSVYKCVHGYVSLYTCVYIYVCIMHVSPGFDIEMHTFFKILGYKPYNVLFTVCAWSKVVLDLVTYHMEHNFMFLHHTL